MKHTLHFIWCRQFQKSKNQQFNIVDFSICSILLMVGLGAVF